MGKANAAQSHRSSFVPPGYWRNISALLVLKLILLTLLYQMFFATSGSPRQTVAETAAAVLGEARGERTQ